MPIRVNNASDLGRYRQQAQAAVPQGGGIQIPGNPQGGMDFARMAASLPAGQRAAVGKAGEEVAALGGMVLSALEKRRAMQDAADYADATTRLEEEAVRFQAGFAKERQGRDARGASDAFFGQVSSAAERMAEGFGDRPELAGKFMQYSRTLALRALGKGIEYEERQEAAVRKDALDGKLALFSNALGTGTDAEILMARAEYEGALRALAPGLDHAAQLARLDQAQAGAAFERRLAAGDLAGAGAVLQRQGGMLGDRLPQAEQKLKAAQRAAAAEAERIEKAETGRRLSLFQAALQGAQATFRTEGARKELEGLRGRIPEASFAGLAASVEQVDADRVEGLAAAQLPLPALKESQAGLAAVLSERDAEGRSPHSPEELANAAHRLKVLAPFVRAREADYRENPAGAARRSLLAGTSPAGAITEGMPEEEQTRLIVEDQRLNGVAHPQVIPDGLAYRMNLDWKSRDLQGKADMARGIGAKYGQFSRQAMEEIAGPSWTEGKDGSPGRYSLEAEAASDFARDSSHPEESAAFMTAHSLRGKAVETDLDDADVKDALLAGLEESESYAHALALARRTGSAELNGRARALRETAEVLARQGRSPKEIAAILDRGKKFVEMDGVPAPPADAEEQTARAMKAGWGEAEAAAMAGVPGFFGSGGENVPFRVRAELPPGMGEEELARRIGGYGRQSLVDYAKLAFPDIPRPKRNGGGGGSGGPGMGGETEEEYAARLAQWKEARAGTEAARKRMADNLMKGGWWGNDPSGREDRLGFFSSTGALLFVIPARPGSDGGKE